MKEDNLARNEDLVDRNNGDRRSAGRGESAPRCPYSDEAPETFQTDLCRFADLLPLTYFEMDLKGNITFVNRHGLDLFGYAKEELRQGDLLMELLVPADRERAKQNLAAIFQGGGTMGNEYVVRRKDGSTFPAMTYSSARQARGKILGLRGILVDIAPLKETEEALRQSESRIRSVVDTAVDGIITVDEEGRMESVNRAVKKIFGYGPDELIGENVTMLMPEPYRSEHQTYLSNYLRTGEKKIIGIGRELTAMKKNGAIFPIYLAVSETRLGARRIFTGIVRDISLRKKAEEALKAKNRELEAFTYMVSHDLKAPLRGILGYAQELTQQHPENLETRPKFCLQQIMAASRNMDQLIEDLLQYARVDSENLAITEVEIEPLINQILNERRPALEASGTRIDMNISLQSLPCWHRGLAQVLGNLIDNAIKFSRQAAPPVITIRAEERAAAYRISVSDNGVGFDMKYQDRLFELFQRLCRPEDFEGTGAGLAIAKKIMDLHRGRIWAESKPGAGAAFYLELPRQAGFAENRPIGDTRNE